MAIDRDEPHRRQPTPLRPERRAGIGEGGAGFTAAVGAGPGQVSRSRSFDPNAEETVFFPSLVTN
jgi:hypothetical protein